MSSSSDVNLWFCQIRNNNAHYGKGGGIMMLASTARFFSGDLTSNQCQSPGGAGLYVDGTSTALFQDSLFMTNSAFDTVDATSGGGFYVATGGTLQLVSERRRSARGRRWRSVSGL